MLFSGRCVGGPFHGKPAHHGERIMVVWVNAQRLTKVEGRAPLAPPVDDLKKCHYAHDETEGIWIWYPSSPPS